MVCSNVKERRKADTCPNNHRNLECSSYPLLVWQYHLSSYIFLATFWNKNFIWAVSYAARYVLIKIHLCFQEDWKHTAIKAPFSSVSESCPTLYSNSCSSHRWCHPAISSSVIPFSSHLKSFTSSGSFPMSQLLKSDGQSIGAPKNKVCHCFSIYLPHGLQNHCRW